MKHKLLWGIGIVALGVGGLFLLGSTDAPDCGSQATRDLIAKIAKDHPNNKLLEFVFYHSKQQNNILGSDERNNLLKQGSKLLNLEKKVASSCIWPDGTRYTTVMSCMSNTAELSPDQRSHVDAHNSPIIKRLKQLKENERAISKQVSDLYNKTKHDVDELWNSEKLTAEYSMNTIRTTSVNSQTEAVLCAAKLHVDVPKWGNAEQDIKYKVERTSNGNLYATLYGFGD